MAEEQLPPVEGEAEVVVVPDDEAPPAPKTVEDFARVRGWKPKEEFDGPEDSWRDAEGFLAFGLDRNKDLFNEVKSLRDTTDRMARTQAQITEQAVERARSEERQRWETIHKSAVEEGDLSAATQAVQKIAELANPAPTRPAGDPLVQRFIAENPWFNSDPAARAIAIAVADRGGTVEEQLAAARAEVHRRFPEYAPQQAKPAPAVAQPANRAADTRNRKKGFNDMPSEAQQACRELVKRGLATQDGYVSNYYNQGAV